MRFYFWSVFSAVSQTGRWCVRKPSPIKYPRHPAAYPHCSARRTHITPALTALLSTTSIPTPPKKAFDKKTPMAPRAICRRRSAQGLPKNTPPSHVMYRFLPAKKIRVRVAFKTGGAGAGAEVDVGQPPTETRRATFSCVPQRLRGGP